MEAKRRKLTIDEIHIGLFQRFCDGDKDAVISEIKNERRVSFFYNFSYMKICFSEAWDQKRFNQKIFGRKNGLFLEFGSVFSKIGYRNAGRSIQM